MSTFLQLCADLARESGAINPAPSTVTGQTGRQLQCVNWIINAYVLIQNISPDWSFLRGEFTGTLTIDDPSYTGVNLGIATRFGSWLEDTRLRQSVSIYDNSIGRSDENHLRQVSYDTWKDNYDFGEHDSTRPSYWAISPDGTIRFAPNPDKAYKVRGEYRKTPQVLAADADTPEMPERFHSAIWQRALMLMAASDEAVNHLTTARMEFYENLANMQRDLLPRLSAASFGPIDR